MKPVTPWASATRAPSRGTPGLTALSNASKARSCRNTGAWPFAARYFTSRTALQHSLEAFMQSYNHERPHQGYRVRGRTPAALFWGAARG